MPGILISIDSGNATFMFCIPTAGSSHSAHTISPIAGAVRFTEMTHSEFAQTDRHSTGGHANHDSLSRPFIRRCEMLLAGIRKDGFVGTQHDEDDPAGELGLR
jgi:hypothetical protein